VSKVVICAIDDWDDGAGAVHVARTVARCFRLPLVYVHVVEHGRGEEGAVEAFGLLRHAVETTSGVEASSKIEQGHPADRIVALAKERDAAYVVLGCHGPRSSLLGSVSADVSRRAPCPVLIVPPDVALAPEPEPEADESPFAGGIIRFDLGRPATPTTP
jgi:nucleotide-binding universal stress UspA family protein